MRRVVKDHFLPDSRKKRHVEQASREEERVSEHAERIAYNLGGGAWPPPGMVTYRRCQGTELDRKGEYMQCPEVALVAILPGSGFQFETDPKDPALCAKRHGGRK